MLLPGLTSPFQANKPIPNSEKVTPRSQRAHLARGAACGRQVALSRVIHDHAIRVKTPAERADGALHALDPAAGQTVLVALIIKRDDFFAENASKIFGVARVMDVHVRMRSAGADRESVQAVIGLRPPAIEHGKIQAAV